MTTKPDTVESTPTTPVETEVQDLQHRVAVLEAWVRMVEGQVTGPLSALPTLDEAELRVDSERSR